MHRGKLASNHPPTPAPVPAVERSGTRRFRHVLRWALAVLVGLALLVVSLPLATADLPGSGAHPHPQDVRIVTDDLPRFWRAYDAARGQPNREAVFGRLYLNPGSAGLKEFMAARPENFAGIGDVTGALVAYYDAIRPTTLALANASLRGRILACLRGVQAVYPAARFQDVTLALGSFQTGGTTGRHFLLIGAEFYSRTPGAPEELLNPWARENLAGSERLPFLIAHELIHTLQRRTLPERFLPPTLLRQALTEGVADFVAELGCGQPPRGPHYTYGLTREREVWKAFRRDLHSTDTAAWLYQGEGARGHPADLAYFVGYRIARRYAARTPDKVRAVRELLRLRDPAAVLRASGYAP